MEEPARNIAFVASSLLELRGRASSYTHIQNSWRRGLFYEAQMLEHIRENYSGGQFVDAGASVGNHTVFFAQYCGAEVLAFEPVDEVRDHLKRNVALNSLDRVVSVFGVALGDSNCCGTMVQPVNGNEGMWSFLEVPGETDMYPLSDFEEYLSDVRLLKIDAERCERRIIEGALSVIERFHPALFVECQLPDDLSDMRRVLGPLGYEAKNVFNATPTYEFTWSRNR